MGLGLDQNRRRGPGSAEAPPGVRVQDAFDIRASYGVDQAPGVVLVLESFPVEAPRSLVGCWARVRTPEGRCREVSVDDVRDHGETVSLFFKNLTRADLPAGSVVEFPG